MTWARAYCPRCGDYTVHWIEIEPFTATVRECVRCGLVASDGIPKKTGIDTEREVSRLDEHADNVLEKGPKA